MEFPASMEPQTKTLFWPQALKKIEELLSASEGGRVTFEPRFTGEEPESAPEPPPPARSPEPIKPLEKASKPSASPPLSESGTPALSPSELEEFRKDPLIQKALEVFKAEILVDPLQSGGTAD